MATVRWVLLLLLVALPCCFPDASSSARPPPPPPYYSTSPLVCVGLGAAPPVVLLEALAFCGLSVGMRSCCNAVDDAVLMEQYLVQLTNVSDQACPATTIKDMLCSRCLPSDPDEQSKTPALGDLLCASPPSPSSASASAPPVGLCLERIAAGSYHGFTPHPADDADSNRAFIWTQDAKIWAVSVPAPESGAALRVEAGRPFLDLADRVHFDAARGLGLMGVALDPRFATTGRLYVSYACDSSASPACSGSSAAAAPSRPCRYLLVVAEFSAAKAATGDYSKATRADPSQVRRIFDTCLPQGDQQHTGQLLFRSGDHYMYLMLGTGGEEEAHGNDDGQIIRFDVGGTAGQGGGNCSIQPMVFATGLGALRGCMVDSRRPYRFYCASVDQYEEKVYLLSDEPGAGSYSASSAKAAAVCIIDHGRPSLGRPTPSIVSGLVYRGPADHWLRGRYLYMYGSAAWAAVETPAGSGRYVTSRIPYVACSRSSPVPCIVVVSGAGGAGAIGGGRVLSFGEDHYTKDAFLLSADGLYRVVAPSLCGAPPPAPRRHKSARRLLAWPDLLPGVLVLALALLVFGLVCYRISAPGGAHSYYAWFIICCIRGNNNGATIQQRVQLAENLA